MKDKKRNPDPITGEPKSHPIGTGIGAAAGGAAATGAAVGAAAGPVGAAAGAAVGAVAGGLAGHAAAEAMNPTKIRGLIGFTVVDNEGKEIGTVECVWEDHTGQPAFLGVRTGWLGLGKLHIMPAYSAEANESKKQIRVPFTSDVVRKAPTFDAKADVDQATEDSIYDYYSDYGVEWDQSRDYQGADPDADYVDEETDRDRDYQEGEESRVTLKKEEMRVGKRQVDDGGVRLRKIVRTREVNEPVELRREEVVIERVPAGEGNVQGEIQEEDIFIPLRREEAVVEKRISNQEEVRVRKRTKTERQDIQGTVREEEVEIEGDGHDVEK